MSDAEQGGAVRDRPALLFDGRCGFCTAAAEWIVRHLKRTARVVPWQQVDLTAYGLTEQEVRKAAWWVDERGQRYGAHYAIAQALIACGGAGAVFGRLISVPPLAWAAAPTYFLIARYRRYLPGTTPACRQGPRWPREA